MKIIKELDGSARPIIDIELPKAEKYVKLEPYVDENGIWLPCEDYGVEGVPHAYKCLITKELFVEAYEKWIKNDSE